jgi:putative ABC transport system permease protein
MRFVTFIIRNLTQRRIRTLLTVLGLSVSVGAMVALLGVSERFAAAIADSFTRRGVDLVVLEAGKPDQASSELEESVGDRIRAIPGVLVVSESLLELLDIRKGDSSISVLVQGWRPENQAFHDLQMLQGRKLESTDRHVCLLGVTLAQNLNKSVGDKVIVADQEFEVIGVFQSFTVFENGGLIILLEEMQREIRRRPKVVTGFSVVVDPNSDPQGHAAAVQRVREQIEQMTDSRGRQMLSALPTQDYVKNSLHVKLPLAMAWMTSMIALLIGTIGMLNTMITSVLERVKEIGILRAIGWPRRRIVAMILGESVTLSITAALVGTVAAVCLVWVLAQAPTVNGFIDGTIALGSIVKGLLITVCIGLLGGAYPAYRASLLQPTEALRHD